MKRSIDIASIIGFVLTFALILLGICTNTDAETRQITYSIGNLETFFDVSSVLIVVGGVLGCLLIMFPIHQFKKVIKHLRIIFNPNEYDPWIYIDTLVESAKKARTSGLLALEENLEAMEHTFLKNSIQMVVDSVDPEKVKMQMESWMENIDERHFQERVFYDKGAALGPAFGMIGTLIGLINMLKNLTEIDTVGANMAVALITTFYGSLLANVIFMPISNKLRVRHEEEYLCMSLICEGVQAIQAGENPTLIQERLTRMLPEYQRKKAEKAQGDGASDGDGKEKKTKKGKKK